MTFHRTAIQGHKPPLKIVGEDLAVIVSPSNVAVSCRVTVYTKILTHLFPAWGSDGYDATAMSC